MSLEARIAWERRRQKEAADIEKVKVALAKEFNVPRGTTFDAAWRLAWDNGHSAGLEEVRNQFIDLVDLLPKQVLVPALHYSATAPQVPGWYWLRDLGPTSESTLPRIVRVIETYQPFDLSIPLVQAEAMTDCEWAGPIPHPLNPPSQTLSPRSTPSRAATGPA